MKLFRRSDLSFSVYKTGKPLEEVAVRVRIALAVAVGIALATPARASEPGQPLDCEDFVFLLPGYSCSVWQQPADGSRWALFQSYDKVFDNEGHLLRIDNFIGISTACPGVDAYSASTAAMSSRFNVG